MCYKDMEVMTEDKIAVMKLNQLLLQMRTDFLSANSSLSAGVNCSKIFLGNSSQGTIPRSSTYHAEIGKANKRERKRSLPIFPTQIKEEVVDKLDGLLGHLETIGEKSLTTEGDEPQYATINDVDKISGEQREYSNKDEPQYSSIDDIGFETIDDHGVHGCQGYSDGSVKDERYVLDDATCFITKNWFSRHHSVEAKCLSKNSSDFGYLKKFSSNGMIDDIHNLKEHSTLCRRLRSLEASVGITLKKQLHLFVKKKMKVMNVSGCVYCMYAFYEKHKREADEKAQQIRKTIKEQEYLKQTLDEQKKQSDADSLWLESEEKSSYVEKSPGVTCPDDTQRYSWREGLHKSGAKSDSEQLGFDPACDTKKKKLTPLRLRRSIPLWELLRRDHDTPCDQATPLMTMRAEDSTASETKCNDISTPSTAPETKCKTVPETKCDDISSPLTAPETKCDDISIETSHRESITSSNVSSIKNSTSETSETNHSNSNDIEEIESDDVFTNECNTSPHGKYFRTSVFSAQNNADDIVYQRTSNVVKSVIQLNTGMQHAQPEEFVDLVNVVGLNLRDLLTTVDDEIKGIPSTLHKEVEMAHRVLSSDMAELVGKMKIAQKYADTTLDRQNRRNMLQAAHVLAIDAKNLHDTYSKLRDATENSNPS